MIDLQRNVVNVKVKRLLFELLMLFGVCWSPNRSLKPQIFLLLRLLDLGIPPIVLGMKRERCYARQPKIHYYGHI